MFIGMNGNSVFIPAAGDKWNKDSFGIGERGSYWTSTQHGAKEAAFCFYVNPEVSTVEANTRFGGMTVRPVQPGIKIETGEATAIKTTTAKLNGTVENYDKEDESIKLAFLYSKSEDIQNSSDGRTVEATSPHTVQDGTVNRRIVLDTNLSAFFDELAGAEEK